MEDVSVLLEKLVIVNELKDMPNRLTFPAGYSLRRQFYVASDHGDSSTPHAHERMTWSLCFADPLKNSPSVTC